MLSQISSSRDLVQISVQDLVQILVQDLAQISLSRDLFDLVYLFPFIIKNTTDVYISSSYSFT